VTLSHHRAGAGEPLLLVHGIGSWWPVWRPVLAALEAERDVVAIDLPGFGGSAPLPAGTEPSPAALAGAVAGFLDELGLDGVDVAGNSLGGWVGLELARAGRARSVCALSPAGFWNRREADFATLSLRNARAAARLTRGVAPRLHRHAAVRRAALWQFNARGERLAPGEAVASLGNLADCPGFPATLRAMHTRAVSGCDEIRVPVTIAWAEKDRLLPRRQHARARAALPRARHLTLFGCGHVPTWDDPELVARTILTSA
jgi:pimeloyl-ACP methyl ester carboxylesterase